MSWWQVAAEQRFGYPLSGPPKETHVSHGGTSVIWLHDAYSANSYALRSTNGHRNPARASEDAPLGNRITFSAGEFDGLPQLNLGLQAEWGDRLKTSLNYTPEHPFLCGSKKNDPTGRILERDSSANNRRIHYGVPG